MPSISIAAPILASILDWPSPPPQSAPSSLVDAVQSPAKSQSSPQSQRQQDYGVNDTGVLSQIDFGNSGVF